MSGIGKPKKNPRTVILRPMAPRVQLVELVDQLITSRVVFDTELLASRAKFDQLALETLTMFLSVSAQSELESKKAKS